MSDPLQHRVPLIEVSNLLVPGQPLPFRILDSQGRLLLAAGQCVMDARQIGALLERGACVVFEEAQAARECQAHSGGAGLAASKVMSGRRTGSTASNNQGRRTFFDRWEQQVWSLDGLLRVLGRDKGQVAELMEFADQHIALVDAHVDAALFVCIRQDEHRAALYGLTHGLHTATLALLCARNLGWDAERSRSIVLAALTMNAPS